MHTAILFKGWRERFAAVATLLLAIGMSPAWSATQRGLVPQHTEDLRPTFTPASKAGAAKLDFTAFGRDFRLQLATNEPLARLATGTSLQLYKGTLEGIEGSWARIAIHDGLARGMIWDGQELFVVDAAPDGVNDGALGTTLFKLSDAVLERGISLADDAVDVPRNAGEAYDDMLGELSSRTRVSKGEATQSLNVSILADAAVLARFPGDAQARDAILTRLNNVDGIFSSQLGVGLHVESVDIAGDLAANLSATTDSSALLEELGQLRGRTSRLYSTGLTHLFTGRDLNGNTAGIAYTLALCSPRFAASLTMFHSSVALDTLMTAHEIGHVFGAPHDGVQACAATPQNRFIMTPTLDTSVSSFSQCSLEQINKVIDSYSCLVDLPKPAPAQPTPLPGGGDGGGDDGGGDGGGSGGGGSLDLGVLGFLLVVVLAGTRVKARARRAAIRKED